MASETLRLERSALPICTKRPGPIARGQTCSGTWAGLAYPARVRWGGPLCAGCSLAGSKLTCEPQTSRRELKGRFLNCSPKGDGACWLPRAASHLTSSRIRRRSTIFCLWDHGPYESSLPLFNLLAMAEEVGSEAVRPLDGETWHLADPFVPSRSAGDPSPTAPVDGGFGMKLPTRTAARRASVGSLWNRRAQGVYRANRFVQRPGSHVRGSLPTREAYLSKGDSS